jgi:hypothetical protein
MCSLKDGSLFSHASIKARRGRYFLPERSISHFVSSICIPCLSVFRIVSFYASSFFHRLFVGQLFPINRSLYADFRRKRVILVKLFILGNPGCGKSTVIRCIQPLVQGYQWLPVHINDYEILREMFEVDLRNHPPDGKQFRKAEHDGFNIVDLQAFDDALPQLELKATEVLIQNELATPKPLLALIEFARHDYQHAFQQFRPDFFQNAYFLYLHVDIKIGKQRIHDRTNLPSEERTEDDYYVPDDIFETYYNQKEEDNSLAFLAHRYELDEQRIKIIQNNADLEDVMREIVAFVLFILKDTIALGTSANLASSPLASPDRPADEHTKFFQPCLL